MASDPEELLRSIERTREELAHAVDTIAGRLDPKRAAKRGVGVLRDGVTGVVDGARAKLHLGADGVAAANGSAGAKRAAGVVPARLAQVGPLVRRVPKPAAGGLAALLALAAIIAVRRRRR